MAAFLAACGGVAGAVPSVDPLDRAIDAELARAVVMRGDGYPPPYYASLAVTDFSDFDRVCSLGAVRFSSQRRQRIATPDVRVGSHELDNHPVAVPSGFAGRSLGAEDDEFSIRHGLWQVLDLAYKGAAADFLRKQAIRVTRGKAEYDTDDLSREGPPTRVPDGPAGSWDSAGLESLCRQGSAVFRAEPGLLHSEVSVSLQRERWRVRDSEGLRVGFSRDTAEIELSAVDIASDGLKLAASRRFVATGPEHLPGRVELRAAAAELLDDLRLLKLAKSTSPFDAPAVLDPSIAAAVALAAGLRLSGEEQRNPAGAQTFRDKLGQPVIPADLSLDDDPTRARFDGVPLAGTYRYDNQGVPARRVSLIADGVLKGFLLSRYPVVGFSRSNGHGRRPAGYPVIGSPGNLILSARNAVSEGELRNLLREECRRRGKTHGLWVRKLRGFAQQQSAGRQDSIRIFPGLVYLVDAATGELTLVRHLDVVGTPLVLMGNILRASNRPAVTSLIAGVPVSVVAPSLLVSELELQRSEAKPEKPPILAPPPPPEPRGG